MGTLTVNFIGISTQFYATTNLPLPVPARVVFVGGIPPGSTDEHQPLITAADANGAVDFSGVPCLEAATVEDTYWLRGVTMRVLTAGSLPVTRPDCLPSLTEIYPEMELNWPVVFLHGHPAKAYFEILGGELETFLSGQAVSTSLTIDVPETTVALQFQCWASGTVTNVTLTMPTSTPAMVTIKNAAVNGMDGDDFLLSYGVATHTPTLTEVPDLEDILDAAVNCVTNSSQVGTETLAAASYSGLGSQCSNSGYP